MGALEEAALAPAGPNIIEEMREHLRVELRESLRQSLRSEPKIPYSDAGFAILRVPVQRALENHKWFVSCSEDDLAYFAFEGFLARRLLSKRAWWSGWRTIGRE
jgi:hypothetical protein